MSRASRIPARLDLLQSLSGLFLALFMWLHMFFVSSILLGKDVFWHVARFFEGYHIFGKPYPVLVTGVAAVVFTIFVLHAALALRKFPSDWRQYNQFRRHARAMHHGDTTLWLVQVWTGFAMFFLALGLLSLAAYIKIGLEQRDSPGVPYVPAGVEWPGEHGP